MPSDNFNNERRTHGGSKTIEEIGADAPRIRREAPYVRALAADPLEDDAYLPGGVMYDEGANLLAPAANGGDLLDEEFDIEDEIVPPADVKLLGVVKAAVTLSETGDVGSRRAKWNASYRAYRNQHNEGSRYLRKDYGARSRLFIPKTRSAVKKAMTSAATALFTTGNVVNISAQNAADPQLVATGKINHELLNYRLDRSSGVEGIAWFMISMGAVQDASLIGLCCSKQYWMYEENGRGKVIKDRPDCKLIPLDDVLLDNAATWTDPVQTGRFFIVRYPMRVIDVKDNMAAGTNPHGGGAWNDIPEKVMGEAASDYRNSQSTRTARQGGADRYSNTSQPGVKDFDIVWVFECFVKMDGEDWHFWSLGGRHMLTDAKPTRESYKHNQGERPYVIGFGALEAHNQMPISMAEAMGPLQNEINDLRNLRMDTVRQAISPIAIVRRGNRVDMRNLHYRGPDATIMVKEDGDVKFDRAPDASASSFNEADRLNADIDELTGSFSTSTVQSNRSLGETVGGMQLMAGANNAITEFDLRVWVETWVEPVLRQLVRLEQYFETNEALINLAGNKAKLEKDGIDPLSLELDGPILVKVDLGIGAADPMQKLAKFQSASKIAMELAAGGVFEGQVKVKGEGMLAEIYGLSGYPDIDRFFEFTDLKDAEAKKEADEAKAMETQAAAAQAGAQAAGPSGPDPAIEQGKLQLESRKLDIAEQTARNKDENDKAIIRIKYAEMLMKKQQTEGQLTTDAITQNMSAMEMELNEVDRQHARERGSEEMSLKRETAMNPPAPKPRPAAAGAAPRPRIPANDRMAS